MTTENNCCRILENRIVSGQIEVVTGLRVGANVENIEISGLDNPILRSAATGEPYIPGSSLKGKLRSLAEWYRSELPLPSGDLVRDMKKTGRVARVFGVAAGGDRVGPTRVLVRDAVLSQRDRDRFRQGKPITEIKTENSINRLTAMANPRPLERVLAGVRFDYQIVYRILQMDVNGDDGSQDQDNFDNVLLLSMRLLEQDYLGSAGSRGCGQVRFVVNDKPGVLVNGEFRELPPLPAKAMA